MRLPFNPGALPVSLSLTLILALVSPALAEPQVEGSDLGGLKIEVTKPARCTRTTQNGDNIYVKYRGTLQSDGTEFDSSEGREPFNFKLGAHEVITGWDKGLLNMCLGEGRRLTIPPEMAYGNRAMGKIPAGSTLVFETELLGIGGVGAVPAAVPTPSSREGELLLSIIGGGAGAASTSFPLTEAESAGKGSEKGPKDGASGECKLLGPFALLIQGALGILALLSLVYKRWRETPRRPLKVWSFDVSKQVVGSALLHLANLLMSMLSSGQFDITNKATSPTVLKDGKKDYPNPCSFYVLNVAIDTTIGIPILVGLLRILHVAFSRTPLANPPESLKSGNYGHPPRATWWLKQSLIYFIGLVGMKLCVFFLFQLLPWLGWVGDWALRWTEGKAWMQITFVMLIFPLVMNALQYYIIDSFIKDSSGEGYEKAPDDEGDEQEGLMGGGRDSDDEGSSEGANVRNRSTSPKARTKEANPTTVPIEYDENDTQSSSTNADPKRK